MSCSLCQQLCLIFSDNEFFQSLPHFYYILSKLQVQENSVFSAGHPMLLAIGHKIRYN